MNVGQLMSRQIRTCRPDDSLNHAAQIMWETDCGCVPVVQDDDREHPRLVGIVTDRDVCMAAYIQGKPIGEIPVTGIMQRDLATCVATDPIGVALSILRTRQLRRLPVVAGDSELVGLLSLADLARESKREASQLDRPTVTMRPSVTRSPSSAKRRTVAVRSSRRSERAPHASGEQLLALGRRAEGSRREILRSRSAG